MIEDVIRSIVAQELQKIKVELLDEMKALQASNSTVDLYGETLTVDRVAEILNISKSKVYDLTRNPQFPCKKAGSRIIIPTRKFFEWLNEGGTL